MSLAICTAIGAIINAVAALFTKSEINIVTTSTITRSQTTLTSEKFRVINSATV